MIAKSISYAHLFRQISSLAAADRKALFVGWAVAKYILDLDLNELDIALLQELGRISQYGLEDGGDPTRLADKAIFNLEPGSIEDQTLEFAERVAAAGERSLRHVVVAYGDEQIDNEMAARHRDIFRRVLRAETKPMIYSKHGDTAYDHVHFAICTADSKSGKVGDWGQHMEIEALHIASAICEAQDNLRCEPNRRYVADGTGVYHTWSGIKVADANGDIISKGAFKAVRAEQTEFDLEMAAPEGVDVGDPLPTTRAIALLARGVARQSRSWDGFHRGLARVGVRYEPYRVQGQVEGGYLVANGAPDKEDDRITASVINAGYARLCKRFGGTPFEPRAEDISVRGFVPPAYRKAQPDHSKEQSRDLEQLRQSERELAEFESFQQARIASLQRDRASEQARKKLKSREAKLRHHNEQQRRDKERREELDEILRALKLGFDRELGRRRKGRPPKSKPVFAVLWCADEPERSRDKKISLWESKYALDVEGPKRVYSATNEVAIVETANFVAVQAEERQAKIDALRLAHEKFGRVSVVGPPEFRQEILLLAAKMQVPLGTTQAGEAQSLFEASKQADRLAEQQDTAKVILPTPRSRRKASRSPEEIADEVERETRCERFSISQLRELRRKNRDEDRRPRGSGRGAPKEVIARNFLTTMNCDELLLCSSRYEKDGVRFLDDVRLLQKFESMPQALLRPEVQQRLEAIRRVQEAKRAWILAGLRSKRFTLEGSELKISDGYGKWPGEFVKGQCADPQFARQIRDAAAGAYSGPEVDLSVHPALAVWRRVNADSQSDKDIAPCVVDEWMRTTTGDERDAAFGRMGFAEGEKLRRSQGLAAEFYRSLHYRKDGESIQNFRRRKRIAELSERQSGR